MKLFKKVSEWLEITEEDLRIAKHSLTLSSGVPCRIMAFHAQQCAEKYLKGFLVINKTEFPFTYSSTTLPDLCTEIKNSFEKLRDAEFLTSYAIAGSYPGEYNKLKKQEASNSIKLAEKVKNKISKTLN